MRADLSSYNLSGANLNGTNFSGANLSGETLTGALGVDSTIFTGATLDGMILPEGYRLCGGYVVGGERPIPWSFAQALVTPLEGQIAELSQRPTAQQLAAVVAERDARPTAVRSPRASGWFLSTPPEFDFRCIEYTAGADSSVSRGRG